MPVCTCYKGYDVFRLLYTIYFYWYFYFPPWIKVQPGMINKRTQKDQTALLLAVSKGKEDCVACLLEKGADPDIANKDKETPLYKGTGGGFSSKRSHV